MEIKYNIDQNIHSLFQEQACMSPDRIAVVDEEKKITYKELDTYSNQLANHLLTIENKTERVIGLCLERKVDNAIAILAILKAGAAFMPLDPNSPENKLNSIILNSKTNIILSHIKFENLFHTHQEKLILLDKEADKIFSFNTNSPNYDVDANNICYVLHTSGTTGEPKGVVMEHRPLTNLISWHKYFLKDKKVRTLGYASFNFDVSIQEFFSACCSGGTYYITPESIKLYPHKLAKFIKKNRIERIFMPFTPLQYFINEILDREIILDSLKSIITAGETLIITDNIRKFFNIHPQCHLRNQYGPTETHAITDYLLDGEIKEWPEKPSIGTPITNTKVYILDKKLNPVKEEQGEIFIGGVCVARGYLNKPELTKEKFLPDPFSKNKNDKMYKTGDLAKWSSNGSIEFLGRKDTQVKLRGFRVELGEVESAIMQHKSIKLAATKVLTPEPHKQQLVAYLVPEPEQTPSIFALRTFLGARLPVHMIPHAFVFMEKLPINENGKLDKKALPNPSNPVSNVEHVPAKNDTEKKLVSIWQKLLSIEKLGINDDFFILGGDSILAARLITYIEKNFSIEISLIDFYGKPTISEIGSIINKKMEEQKKQEDIVLTELLDQIENMTEEEVETLLNKQ